MESSGGGGASREREREREFVSLCADISVYFVLFPPPHSVLDVCNSVESRRDLFSLLQETLAAVC